MTTGDVLTYRRSGLWFVHIEGGREPQSSHDTRDEAVSAGRELAIIRECKHVVADYKPRGAAIQSDLGAGTGGQASP
jgi:hypothetical protein